MRDAFAIEGPLLMAHGNRLIDEIYLSVEAAFWINLNMIYFKLRRVSSEHKIDIKFSYRCQYFEAITKHLQSSEKLTFIFLMTHFLVISRFHVWSTSLWGAYVFEIVRFCCNFWF